MILLKCIYIQYERAVNFIMKHAIMVMGFGNKCSVLQETINILDDKDIDFFIHWDKRYKLPDLHSNKSKIIFVPRIKVNWATYEQTLAEKMLMTDVINSKNHYDYVHLISSVDMPLMTLRYFKNFFKKNTLYLGFFDYIENYKYDRIKYYYPVAHINLKRNLHEILIMNISKYFNKLFHIDRLRNKNVEHGCNWFSMDIKYVKEILNFKDFDMFKYTAGSDEFYVQTALQDLKPCNLSNKYNYYSDNYRMTESSKMAARYIDWYRGCPYVFTINNVKELKSKKNTKYAFARKIYDPNIIKSVFS